MASVGQVIDDKYEILKLVGMGGMSKVYLAMDKRLNKQWAVKEIEINTRDKNSNVLIQSAIDEANMIKHLDHPCIVRIVDIIQTGNKIYIIEDYIEGETLGSMVEKNGAQPQEMVIEWAKQICETLEYLHTQDPPIIYRDMKPANVMLKPDGTVKMIDFGIAREYKEGKSGDTVSLGTRGYAAPEQFGGKGQTDARTDIYCLGVTLYHLVTGQNPSEPPYEIYPIRRWNPQLSAGLEAIIEKCTQFDPNQRYQSCAELLYVLNHYEEYSEAYRQRQKKKLRIFFLTFASVFVFAGIGCLGLGMRSHTNNADFEQNILQAEKASTSEEKANYYAIAAGIKPDEPAGYLGMIDAFKDDASFTTEEELLRKSINSNLVALREREDYASLAFEIGKLYWYYYDYGRGEQGDVDNQVTRMKSAIQWFEDAVQYGNTTDNFYKMATIYRDIGKFNRDITLNIEEASDNGQYLPYWNNITSLVQMIQSDASESEIIQLEVYRMAMFSIETYARKFKGDGVEKEDMLSLFSTARNAVAELNVTSDKTEQLKTDISNRADAVQAAIENAYREQVE